jgi:PAS domain S-box-containing protein
MYFLNARNYIMNTYALPMLFVGATITSLGFFVFFRKRNSSVSISFLFMCLSVGLYLIASGISYLSRQNILFSFWFKVGTLGVVCIPISVLLLTVARFDLFQRYGSAVAACIFVSILFGLGLFLTDGFIHGVKSFFWGNYGQYSTIGFTFIGFFFSVMVFILYIYWQEYKHTTRSVNKKRIKLMFITFSVGYLVSIDFLPSLGIPIYPFGYIPILLFATVWAFIVVRYRLVEITPEKTSSQILGTMKGGVIVTDCDKKIRAVNRIVQDTMGYHQTELLGKDLESIFPGLAEFNHEGRDGERMLIRETTWRSKSGQQVDVNVCASLIKDEFDECIGMVYVSHDFAERKQMEKALEESALCFRALFENAPIALFIHNGETGEIIEANRKALEASNVESIEELRHKGAWLPEPYSQQAAISWVRKAAKEGPQRLEWLDYDRQGNARWRNISLTAIALNNGPRIMAIVQDITERKRFEELTERKTVEDELRKSLKLLGESQRIAHIGSWELDIATQQIIGTEEALNIFSLDKLAFPVALKDAIRMFHPDDQIRALRHYENILNTNVPGEREYRIVKQDGSIRNIRMTGRVEYGSAGVPHKILGTIQDITEHKKLERQMLAIEDRERANIGRDIHDGLGQILTAAAFKCEVLERSFKGHSSETATTAHELAELLNAAKEHTRYIVKGLVPVDANLTGLADGLRQLCESCGSLFHIPCEFRCNPAAVVKDYSASIHLYRIAQESITNAAKYGKPTRIIISLEKDQSRVILKISDDGVGFNSEKKSGKGMGMRIMSYRAQLINAELTVSSRPNAGTIISCTYESENTR